MEKVSIVIQSNHNQGSIYKCVLSALTQSYSHIEIIIVDCNSNDKTSIVLKQLIKRYPEILIRKTSSVNDAYSLGYRLSSGTYLMFVDGNDEIPYNAVEKLVVAAKTYQAKLVCGGNKVKFEYFSIESKQKKTHSLSSFQALKEVVHGQKLDEALHNKLFHQSLFTQNILQSWYAYGKNTPVIELIMQSDRVVIIADIVYITNHINHKNKQKKYAVNLEVLEHQSRVVMKNYPKLQRIYLKKLRRAYFQVMLTRLDSRELSKYARMMWIKCSQPFYHMKIYK